MPDSGGALGADIYLFSLYKTWGPHLGLMTIKKQIMDALPNQGHFFNAHLDRKKMMPAGPDHAQIAAAAGVAQYLDAVFAGLTAKKIMAGQGHFYGVRPLMGMHIPIETGVLRLSFLHYTTEDEISQLIGGLSSALG